MSQNKFFEDLKLSIQNIDPIFWIENNLTLDSKPFRIHGNGYKPLADIYRTIGIKALEVDSGGKPIVICKGRRVGLTTLASALECYWMASGLFGHSGKPPIRVMHLFPLLELAYSYSKSQLSTMISAAKPDLSTKQRNHKSLSVVEAKMSKMVEGSSNSLQFKQFENSNQLWVEGISLTGDRLRGRTSDISLADECQDMRAEALANVIKIFSTAQYGPPGQGVQVYFGTPKSHNSKFAQMWNQSSKQHYYLKCVSCEEFFPLYLPNNANQWEQTWIHGFTIRCPKCGHHQDKRQAAEHGKWIALNPDPNAKYVGFHINQLLIPTFSKEHIESEKPENSAINSEKIYMNEVLGEFYSGSTISVTPESIEKTCADHGRHMSKSLPVSTNYKVYMGIDWGDKLEADVAGESKKSKGQSYSVVTILKTDGPHILSLEYCYRLKSRSPDYKLEFVDQMFRDFSVDLCVGDIGFANDLSYTLAKKHGSKFLTSRAIESVKHHIKFASDVFPSEIQFERNYYIEYVFDMLQKGKIRLPYGDYEKIGYYVEQLCAFETKTSVDRNGEVKLRYTKSSVPNDSFFSLINSILAYLYDQTNGFKIINPNEMVGDPAIEQPVLAILGKIKRRF